MKLKHTMLTFIKGGASKEEMRRNADSFILILYCIVCISS